VESRDYTHDFAPVNGYCAENRRLRGLPRLPGDRRSATFRAALDGPDRRTRGERRKRGGRSLRSVASVVERGALIKHSSITYPDINRLITIG